MMFLSQKQHYITTSSFWAATSAAGWRGLVVWCICYFLLVPAAHTQSLVTQTEVTNYNRYQYNAGTQNWALARDTYGRLFIANNEGLLVFKGSRWQLYPVPNKTILRSIALAKDGKLYAGAQDELGYFAADQRGQLRFNSLRPLLPKEDTTFTDVWDTKVSADGVFFRTTETIFQLANNRITTYKTNSAWVALLNLNGRMAAQDKEKGLVYLQNGRIVPFLQLTAKPADFVVTDVAPFREDTLLVSTNQYGLFLMTKQSLLPFQLKNTSEQNFTALCTIDSNQFIAGSYANGIYRFNAKRTVTENINGSSGLINNTVRCVAADPAGNVWVGLDNGVSFIANNNAIKHITPASFKNGSGYGVQFSDGQLYFALTTGLFALSTGTAADLGSIAAAPAPVLNGLTWNTTLINNQLLTARDDGFWSIRNNSPNPINRNIGYWTYKRIPNKKVPLIAAGHYKGIHLYEFNNGNLVLQASVPGFYESSRYIETDSQYIWVSHPYRGVFKINHQNLQVTKYAGGKGLPGELDIHVFTVRNQVVFATPKGIYEYNSATDTFVPAVQYAGILGTTPVRYLKEDAQGNIWFVTNKMVGVIDNLHKRPTVNYIPELNNRIMSGFENIFVYNINNVFVGSESGFYLVNYEKYKSFIQPFTAYLNTVRITGGTDSVLFGGYGTPVADDRAAMPYRFNSLQFTYASSYFAPQHTIEYSYYLNGFDKQWSQWSPQSSKEYTNLPEGDYTFQVKARKSPGNESEMYMYRFTIRPPWYRTWWARILYVVAVFAFFAWLYRRYQQQILAQQKKFEEEQKKLTYIHELERSKTTAELVALKNEKLEAEINFKNSEVASAAMHLVKKGELLTRIKADLSQMMKRIADEQAAAEIKKMIKSLHEDEQMDEEWENFTKHFDKVNSDFVVRLKQVHTNLTSNELKLCTYLRMNLSTKEIAQLMNISVRGVEISRYRLRKKIGISSEMSLFDYLLSINNEDPK